MEYKEHKITSEETWNFGDYNVEHHLDSLVDSLQEYLKEGESIQVHFLKKGIPGNLENVVKRLRQERLNIGENNEQFGYRLDPQSQNLGNFRKLFVYRRAKCQK